MDERLANGKHGPSSNNETHRPASATKTKLVIENRLVAPVTTTSRTITVQIFVTNTEAKVVAAHLGF